MSRSCDTAPSSRLSKACKRLCNLWPGRELQIRQFVSLVGIDGAPTPNLFCCGPLSTGKTSIVRSVFRELGKQYVYVSAAEFRKTGPLLQSIARQLETPSAKQGKKRRRENGFGSHLRGIQPADFVADLPGLAKGSSIAHIVVDEAHRLADKEVLALLTRLQELTGVQMSVILLSQIAWEPSVFETDTMRAVRPMQISFPAYEPSTLAAILAVKPLAEIDEFGIDVFTSFMRAEILPTFARSTRRLEDIQALVHALFPLYLRPLSNGSLEPEDKRQLHSQFHSTLLAAKAAFEAGPGWKGLLANLAETGGRRPQKQREAELDFELPYYSKFLLLAAFICSRNKPSLDRRIFDPSLRSKKTRGGHRVLDKKAGDAKEAALKGPHSFALERMLAVFWKIVKAEDDGDGHISELSGDLSMQISSLASLKLLSRVSADDLDEAIFRCNIEEGLALTIARNLSIKLQDYVIYA